MDIPESGVGVVIFKKATPELGVGVGIIRKATLDSGVGSWSRYFQNGHSRVGVGIF